MAGKFGEDAYCNACQILEHHNQKTPWKGFCGLRLSYCSNQKSKNNILQVPAEYSVQCMGWDSHVKLLCREGIFISDCQGSLSNDELSYEGHSGLQHCLLVVKIEARWVIFWRGTVWKSGHWVHWILLGFFDSSFQYRTQHLLTLPNHQQIFGDMTLLRYLPHHYLHGQISAASKELSGSHI